MPADPDRPNTAKEQADLKRGLDVAWAAEQGHAEGCGATKPHPNRSGWMGQCTCGLDALRSSSRTARTASAPERYTRNCSAVLGISPSPPAARHPQGASKMGKQGKHSLAWFAVYEPETLTLEEYRRLRAEADLEERRQPTPRKR